MMNRTKKLISRYLTYIAGQCFVCAFLLCLFGSAKGQEGLSISSFSDDRVVVEYNLKNIKAIPYSNTHSALSSPAANSLFCSEGMPMLPQYRQLIALDRSKILEIIIERQEWDTLSLSDIGCHLPLTPYCGAKTKETPYLPAPADSVRYATDSLTGPQLIAVAGKGLSRNTPIAELVISPVRYNPAAGTIAVCRKLTATIAFTGGIDSKTLDNTPLLRAMPVALPFGRKEYVNTLAQDSVPQVYLAVSATQYRETLQPLLEWKRQEGYIVEEIYFDRGTYMTVKDSLQSRYDNSTDDHPAPLFILLVGDMENIGLSGPQHLIEGLESHRTDFYYSEFTGDMIPDAMVGRLSAHDTAELRPIIEKTLAYEKGIIDDTAALRRSLLVAGTEETEPAPTVTNGQVNYLKQLITLHDPGHDTICFYNPESTGKRNEIIDSLREGVALISYTAHCNSRGWRYPTLNNNDIDNTNVVDSHLCIAVNNCCRSNDVAAECFGEHLLRKAGGGAVGVIGATNETLWEEDYYWSVGFGTISSSPSPDSSTAGAFDRILHPHLQPISEQAWTLGQMLVAGCNAVATSGSPFADFYWEIYLLLGDPSLMPHIGPLHNIALRCDSVQAGDTMLTLTGTPWCRVAATCGDTLMGLCTLDANGEATMHFSHPVSSTICITATRQFHKARRLTFIINDNDDGDSISHNTVSFVDGKEIRIYPNPARNSVTINGLTQPATLTIVDMSGRTMLSTAVLDGQTIELRSANSRIAPGIYCLILTTPKETITKRLMISEL